MRLAFFILLILFFGCSIIEDSDITSQDELANLKIKSVEIKQETATGTSSYKATLTSASTVEIPVPNGTIGRQIWMDWSALTAKVKLKSGYTKAFKSYASFLKDGRPYTFYFFDSDSVILELYRFRYDTKGRLNQVITNAPFVDGEPATSRDSLIYNNTSNTNELTSIIRKSADASKAGTFMINSGSFFNLQGFNFQNVSYTKACQGNGCGGPYWGGDYYSIPNNSNSFPIGVLNLGILTGQFYIQDINNNVSSMYCNNQCAQGSDTYYLHPFIILKDQFQSGDAFLFMYMVDWWKPTAQIESNNNEKVTFNFTYEL